MPLAKAINMTIAEILNSKEPLDVENSDNWLDDLYEETEEGTSNSPIDRKKDVL
jgi:hypothetical protein